MTSCGLCGPERNMNPTVCKASHKNKNKVQTHHFLFACVFLPQDEVLAVSKKVVVRVEDLVNWTCSEPPVWTSRSGPRPGARNSLERTGPSSTDSEPPTHKTDGEFRLWKTFVKSLVHFFLRIQIVIFATQITFDLWGMFPNESTS